MGIFGNKSSIFVSKIETVHEVMNSGFDIVFSGSGGLIVNKIVRMRVDIF